MKPFQVIFIFVLFQEQQIYTRKSAIAKEKEIGDRLYYLSTVYMKYIICTVPSETSMHSLLLL